MDQEQTVFSATYEIGIFSTYYVYPFSFYSVHIVILYRYIKHVIKYIVISFAVWKKVCINGTNPDSQQLPTYYYYNTVPSDIYTKTFPPV